MKGEERSEDAERIMLREESFGCAQASYISYRLYLLRQYTQYGIILFIYNVIRVGIMAIGYTVGVRLRYIILLYILIYIFYICKYEYRIIVMGYTRLVTT